MPVTFKNAEILLYKNRQKENAEGQSKPKYHCGKCINRQKNMINARNYKAIKGRNMNGGN
jgi:hypothetical protein